MNDGGSAFPFVRGYEYSNASNGMTLRDWFAGNATEEDVAHWLAIMILNEHPITREEAKYLYADAMIAERDKEVDDADETRT